MLLKSSYLSLLMSMIVTFQLLQAQQPPAQSTQNNYFTSIAAACGLTSIAASYAYTWYGFNKVNANSRFTLFSKMKSQVKQASDLVIQLKEEIKESKTFQQDRIIKHLFKDHKKWPTPKEWSSIVTTPLTNVIKQKIPLSDGYDSDDEEQEGADVFSKMHTTIPIALAQCRDHLAALHVNNKNYRAIHKLLNQTRGIEMSYIQRSETTLQNAQEAWEQYTKKDTLEKLHIFEQRYSHVIDAVEQINEQIKQESNSLEIDQTIINEKSILLINFGIFSFITASVCYLFKK